eukprot:12682582-Alexandrium_andersonii.AAC.1
MRVAARPRPGDSWSRRPRGSSTQPGKRGGRGRRTSGRVARVLQGWMGGEARAASRYHHIQTGWFFKVV